MAAELLLLELLLQLVVELIIGPLIELTVELLPRSARRDPISTFGSAMLFLAGASIALLFSFVFDQRHFPPFVPGLSLVLSPLLLGAAMPLPAVRHSAWAWRPLGLRPSCSRC